MEKSPRIFVTRLGTYTHKRDLIKIFGRYNPLHAVVLRKKTGNVGFVTFRSEEVINQILKDAEITPFEYRDRKLKVFAADSWHHRDLKCPSHEEHPVENLTSGPVLPVTCIAEIAKHLSFTDRSRLERVSRLWRMGSLDSYHGLTYLSLSDSRWQDTWDPQPISLEGFRWIILRCGRFVKSLDLGNEELSAEIKSRVVAIATKECPLLEELNTGTIEIRPTAVRPLASIHTLRSLTLGPSIGPIDQELSEVFSGNPRIKRLKFLKSNFYGRCLVSAAPNLETLVMDNCPNLRPDYLGEALIKMEKLESLSITSCTRLNTQEVLEGIVRNSQIRNTLKELKLVYCLFYPEPQEEEIEEQREPENWDMDFDVAAPDFADLVLGPVDIGQWIPTGFINLTTLHVICCGWVTKDFIVNLGVHCYNLLFLDITGCTNIRGEDSLDSLSNLVQCKELRMSHLHPSVGGSFLRHLVSLEILVCQKNRGITSEDIAGLLRTNFIIREVNVERCVNIDRSLVLCARDTINFRGNLLILYVKGTKIEKTKKDNKNRYLRVVFDRLLF